MSYSWYLARRQRSQNGRARQSQAKRLRVNMENPEPLVVLAICNSSVIFWIPYLTYQVTTLSSSVVIQHCINKIKNCLIKKIKCIYMYLHNSIYSPCSSILPVRFGYPFLHAVYACMHACFWNEGVQKRAESCRIVLVTPLILRTRQALSQQNWWI